MLDQAAKSAAIQGAACAPNFTDFRQHFRKEAYEIWRAGISNSANSTGHVCLQSILQGEDYAIVLGCQVRHMSCGYDEPSQGRPLRASCITVLDGH